MGDCVDRIYPIKLEIKDTTDTARSASYFDNLGKWGPVKNETKEMISIFPFEHSSSICMYVYRVYVYRLIRYSRVCGSYRDFSDRWLLLNKGSCWLSSLHFVATMTWLTVAKYLCNRYLWICSTCRKHFAGISSLMTYHRICN